MRAASTIKIRNTIKKLLQTVNKGYQKIYDEFSDIMDTDEDRLSLQFNGFASRWERRSMFRNFRFKAGLRKSSR